jgi:hypothetical protein
VSHTHFHSFLSYTPYPNEISNLACKGNNENEVSQVFHTSAHLPGFFLHKYIGSRTSKQVAYKKNMLFPNSGVYTYIKNVIGWVSCPRALIGYIVG